MKKIGIIGGGASGLAAAITAAAQKNAEVFILEHKEMAGKKLLSTGNGRCNLTNEKMDSSFFRSQDMGCVETVLKKFGYEETLHFFENLGLMMKSRNGYLYPRCDQSAAVRELLVKEAEALGATICTGIHVTRVIPGHKEFLIHAERPGSGSSCFSAERVILACGGRAAKVLGSDGSGYTLAKKLGHTLSPVVPALVQLKVKRHPLKGAAGVRTEAAVSALVDGKRKSTDTGELQITNYGVSGIPVFQISRYIGEALYEKRCAEVVIDFLPSMEEKEFAEYLVRRCAGRKKTSILDCLTGIFHSKLTPELLALSRIPAKKKTGELSERELLRFAGQCKRTVLSIQDTNGYENAQVCAGGVRLSEIDCATMQSRRISGLYLAGELLDADGMCGGYNLQWAWATGALAGAHAGRRE